jgi:cytochrome c oxidase assembly factor CtaG
LSLPLLLLPVAANAHIESDPSFAWNWEPWLIVSLSLAAALYAIGMTQLAQGADSSHVKWRAASFCAGLAALVIALVSPLDAMGSELFSAHMLQHEVLMLVAAPLIVLGKPLAMFTWALPGAWRSPVTRPFQAKWWQVFWRGLTAPLTAWSLQAITLWGWHAPFLFQASVQHESVHVLQHTCFFFSAILFWWALLRNRANATSALYLLTTMIHTGCLGALLTFAPAALYPVYLETAPFWGLSGLEDQQLGGLMMWVPAGFILLGAGVVIFWQWLSAQSSRKQTARP